MKIPLILTREIWDVGPSHCFARIINFSLSAFPVLRELQYNTQKEVKFHKSKYETLAQAYVEQFLLAYMPMSK